MSNKKSLSEIGQRIYSFRKERKLTQKEFGKNIGISANYLSEIENGVKDPSETLLIALSLRYAINERWLRTGEGEIVAKTSAVGVQMQNPVCPTVVLASKVDEVPDFKPEDYYAAPLIEGKIAAGVGRVIGEGDIRALVWIYAPALRGRQNHDLIAVEIDQVNGDSMMPTVFPGDIVLIDRDEPAGDLASFRDGKIYAIRSGRNGECAIKRLFKDRRGFEKEKSGDRGVLVVTSDNREYPAQIAWTDNLNELIIGRVVWGWRNLLEA